MEPEKLVIYSPENSILDKFFKENSNIVDQIQTVCENLLLSKFGYLRQTENVGQSQSNQSTDLLKPPVPIAMMTYDQIISFFPNFINTVFKFNNIKVQNKWAIKPKIAGDPIIEPTPPCIGLNLHHHV